MRVLSRAESAGKYPIHVMYDSGLTDYERECVDEAMRDFQKMFPGRTVYNYGSNEWSNGSYSSADWYVKQAKRRLLASGRFQLDARSLLGLMLVEPWQSHPHIDVMFTSYDLTAEGLNFCFGMTTGHITVQSVYRYRGLNQTEQKLAIKAVVWHELGHVLGAAGDLGRRNTEDNLGPHCTNSGCIMRQGLNVGVWVSHAKDASRHLRPFCPQCLQEMRNSKI